MNFLEAAEIAKKNPGSHFSRGESGLFVVYLTDGRVINSPDQLSVPAKTTHTPQEATYADASKRLEDLERTVASLNRQLETSNTEIRQLRREVNNLKQAIAQIPASEWKRYEEEQRKLDEKRRIEERDRIVGLARNRQLSHEQLDLVADNAASLGISGEDLEFIRAEVIRTRPRGITKDSLVVHATTDGQ
jgi:predicted RNase H-like nuclease (RuvC/YqgF family)